MIERCVGSAMKKLQVSLNVVSDLLTLSELANRLGKAPSSGSHGKGDPRGTAALQKHVKDIARLFPPESLVQGLPKGCKVYIDVGLIFDSWNSVVVISEEILGIIHAYKAEIELSCYSSKEFADQ